MLKNKIIFVILLLMATAAVAFSSTFIYTRKTAELNNYSDKSSGPTVVGRDDMESGAKATDSNKPETDFNKPETDFNKPETDFNYEDNTFLIVTSCNPMYIAALNVCDGIEGVKVVNLSQPTTGCLHDYSLTTEDMKVLSKADAFIINGGGMEGFLEDVMKAYPNLPIIEASEDLPLLGEAVECHDEDSDGHDGHNHDEEGNSHCWMSTEYYILEVDAIGKGLGEVDKSRAGIYSKNAAVFIAKIAEELDPYQFNFLAGSENKNVMLFHEAFEYVAYDLWFKVKGTMDLDEERQVSAGELQEVLGLIEEEQVYRVLAEETYGSKMGRLVEESTDARVVYLNPMIRGDFDKDSYIEIMKLNYESLK